MREGPGVELQTRTRHQRTLAHRRQADLCWVRTSLRGSGTFAECKGQPEWEANPQESSVFAPGEGAGRGIQACTSKADALSQHFHHCWTWTWLGGSDVMPSAGLLSEGQ